MFVSKMSYDGNAHNEFMSKALRAGAVSVLIGVLLEACTLKGARVASVLRFEDWNFQRILIFAFLAFVLISFYLLAKASGHVRDLRIVIRDLVSSIQLRWKLFLITGSLTILGSILAAIYSLRVFAVIDSRIVAVVFVCVFVATLLVLNWKFLIRKKEYLYLLIALPFGLLYVYLMPAIPEISWDGQIHFSNALRLSYLVDAEFTDADLLMSNQYAVSELNLIESGDADSAWHAKQNLDSVEAAFETICVMDTSGGVTVCDGLLGPTGESSLTVSCVGVVPHAVGLWLGRLLGMSIIGRLLLARLMSSLTYVVIVFYAIKALKHGKLLASSLALLVTPFMMSACFSYDPWCCAFVMFAVCHLVGKIQSGLGSISRYDFFLIVISLLLGCLVKAVYFPLFFVLIFIPNSYFRNGLSKKTSVLITLTAVVILFVSFTVPVLFSSATGTEVVDTRAETGVSTSGQIKFAIMNLPEFLWIILRFIYIFIITTPITASIGSYFVYLYNTPDILGYLAWTLVLGSLLFDISAQDEPIQLRLRISSVLGVLASIFLSVCALYASFTPVGADTVYGFQWRYLIPFYPFIFLIALNFGGKFKKVFDKVNYGNWFPVVWLGLELTYQLINLYQGFIAAF